MRKAEVEDAWRRVGRERGFGLSKIEFRPVPPFGQIDTFLPNGIVVVCGLNGAGKTSLLRLLEATLNGIGSVDGRAREGLLEPRGFAAEVTVDGDRTRVDVGLEGAPASAVVLDPFDLCARVRAVLTQPNAEDVFGGVEAHQFSATELDDVNYVLGNRYDRVEVFEIEDPATDGTLYIPRVERGGHTYTCLEMGTGELAGLMLLWGILQAETKSILLLEEPESFLSSHSSVALMDILARQIDRKRLYAVVTTHSTDVATRAPTAHVRALVARDGGVVVHAPSNQAELEQLLGSFGGQARALFVEDRAARVLVRELLGRYAGLWGQAIQVIEMGGASEVVTVCRTMPRIESVIACGVLDGDQRDHVPAGTLWPLELLPGTVDPALMLRDAATGQLSLFAQHLAREELQVDAAVQQCAATDYHDWFADMGARLNVTDEAALRAACECWLSDAASEAAAKAFIDAVSAALIRR